MDFHRETKVKICCDFIPITTTKNFQAHDFNLALIFLFFLGFMFSLHIEQVLLLYLQIFYFSKMLLYTISVYMV